MAGVRRITYTFSYGGSTYGIKLPESYYNSIDSKLGFSKASASEIKGKFVLTKQQALRNGALLELTILYKKGTRLQRSKILCPPSRVQEAIQSLENDEYRGYKIHSAYFGQQRRLG
ncbi:hypothetical protein [Gloeocapsopsis dulcis]|uniref:Uncharacterized protein n=1 Tax=Gloeocapsopsis dulcis AAB1 = 1H9 TaxID=1433147 RepID=A0A6N8G6X6_9CHRO|nr:hypothetical protein [Gloeocapsopsis dulcis]MUL39346.1 hypothetical protein [Gloeocapsopsis dulcis AAB1 = 1H9]WNN89698.1 hypothetical protein P0S91_00955 [Gloeocapsopsis dulcis]